MICSTVQRETFVYEFGYEVDTSKASEEISMQVESERLSCLLSSTASLSVSILAYTQYNPVSKLSDAIRPRDVLGRYGRGQVTTAKVSEGPAYPLTFCLMPTLQIETTRRPRSRSWYEWLSAGNHARMDDILTLSGRPLVMSIMIIPVLCLSNWIR